MGRLTKAVLSVDLCGKCAGYDWVGYRLTFKPEVPGCRSTFWLACIQIDPASARVGGTSGWPSRRRTSSRYPFWKPMHLQPIFAQHPVVGRKVAEGLFEGGLCLASGSSMTDADRERVVEVTLRFANR